MTVDDQMDMKNTSKDTDMTADCSNEKTEKCKTVQVSEVQGAARKVKWDIHRSPVSCKTTSKNTEAFSLPTSLPQANLLSPVKEVPVTIPDLDSRYLLDEICDLFESDSANDPYINNDILNTMDQNWLESFAECLNAWYVSVLLSSSFKIWMLDTLCLWLSSNLKVWWMDNNLKHATSDILSDTYLCICSANIGWQDLVFLPLSFVSIMYLNG